MTTYRLRAGAKHYAVDADGRLYRVAAGTELALTATQIEAWADRIEPMPAEATEADAPTEATGELTETADDPTEAPLAPAPRGRRRA